MFCEVWHFGRKFGLTNLLYKQHVFWQQIALSRKSMNLIRLLEMWHHWPLVFIVGLSISITDVVHAWKWNQLCYKWNGTGISWYSEILEYCINIWQLLKSRSVSWICRTNCYKNSVAMIKYLLHQVLEKFRNYLIGTKSWFMRDAVIEANSWRTKGQQSTVRVFHYEPNATKVSRGQNISRQIVAYFFNKMLQPFL